MQFDLTVTNGMPSVARVSATLARVSSSPLSSPLPLIHPLLLSHPSHPSLLPQALSFICLSPADSLHPSLHLRPSLHPPSLSLSSSDHCLLFSLPPFLPSFQPCQFLRLCVCFSSPPVTFLSPPPHLCHSLLSFSFILSSPHLDICLFIHLSPALCPPPHLYLIPLRLTPHLIFIPL